MSISSTPLNFSVNPGSGYKNFKTINDANADPGIPATAAGLSSSTSLSDKF